MQEPANSQTTKTNRKRKFSFDDCSPNDEETETNLIDSSCAIQSVPFVKKLVEMPARPKSLLLSSPKTHRSFPSLRTCFSHPSTSSTQMDNTNISTMTFSSVKNLFSPPTKRQRSEIICSSVDISNSSNFFIDAFELAEKLNESSLLTIFDCGSPFRHSERRIRGASLLRVADKISRKRLKLDLFIDDNLVNGSSSIVLYDDQTSTSLGLKCVLKEIERTQFPVRPMVRILNCSFSRFFDLFPNLCESDSMVMNQQEASVSTTTKFSERASENCEIEHHPMTHIIDGLFIGGESNAKDLQLLKSEGVRRIINVTSHVPLYHPTEFQYLHLPADDTQKQNLIDNFDETFHFIRQAIENKENVLVHCVAGISRSPAIVIAFLMRHANMKMNQAYEFVKRKRSIISPNFNFMGQLLEYEKRLEHQQDDFGNT